MEDMENPLLVKYNVGLFYFVLELQKKDTSLRHQTCLLMLLQIGLD